MVIDVCDWGEERLKARSDPVTVLVRIMPKKTRLVFTGHNNTVEQQGHAGGHAAGMRMSLNWVSTLVSALKVSSRGSSSHCA